MRLVGYLKRKFVCFRKCKHERYTGHERFRFCCFTADGSAKSRKLTFVSVSLSSVNSNLRNPTLYLIELCLCSCLTLSPVSYHALKLRSNVDSGYGISLYRSQIIPWWSRFMKQVTSFLQGNNKPSSLYLFGISLAASVMASNPTFFLESGSISSTPTAP